MLVTRSGIFDRTQFRWDIGGKEAYPAWRAIKKDSNHLRSRFGFVAGSQGPSQHHLYPGSEYQAGMHRNGVKGTLAAMVPRLGARRHPHIFGARAQKPLQRFPLTQWRSKWREIFHARTAREQKLARMTRTVKGNPASQLLEPDVPDNPTAAKPEQTEAAEQTSPSKSNHEETEEDDTPPEERQTHRQFLVIMPQDPPVLDKLDKHETNLAGKSLLPNIQPVDWPSVETIAASQLRYLTARTRRRLQKLETAVPNTYVYLNDEAKIVIPT